MRLRLSQFVILPPYQHLGHGSRLYSALFKNMLGRDGVAELTVEDPAEAFEDLRDRNDLRFLVEQGVPEDPKFLVGVGEDSRLERANWEAALRKKYKIAQVSTRTRNKSREGRRQLTVSVNSTGCWRCSCFVSLTGKMQRKSERTVSRSRRDCTGLTTSVIQLTGC